MGARQGPETPTSDFGMRMRGANAHGRLLARGPPARHVQSRGGGNYRHAQLWGHDNHQQNVGPHGATLVTWTLSSMRVKESPWTRDCPGAHTGPSRLRRSNPPQATFHGGNAPGLREVAATWDDLEAGFAPISSLDKFERSRLHDASVNGGQSRVSVFEKLHYVSLHVRAWGAVNTHTHV